MTDATNAWRTDSALSVLVAGMRQFSPAIERVSVQSLKPYPRNARRHSKAQIKQITASIERFGFNNPVLIADGGEIVAGHGRVEDAIPAYRHDGAAVTRPGDLWLLGRHKIFCGDARDANAYAALLADEVVDLICTDPPYNVPIDGHVCGSGRIRHRNFAMGVGVFDLKVLPLADLVATANVFAINRIASFGIDILLLEPVTGLLIYRPANRTSRVVSSIMTSSG